MRREAPPDTADRLSADNMDDRIEKQLQDEIERRTNDGKTEDTDPAFGGVYPGGSGERGSRVLGRGGSR